MIEGGTFTPTVNLTPLLDRPLRVTTTLPDVAPPGTAATTVVAFQVEIEAETPLKVTVPGVEPKLVPVMVTEVPTGPDMGDRAVMPGDTLKDAPLLFIPLALTTMFPVVAPEGTGTTMAVGDQDSGEAVTPLNVTVPAPWAPKFTPEIITGEAIGPEKGLMSVMTGA